MGDNGDSGDVFTQTSTGYSLKLMFMFISCIIMNIVMFNCGLNIHTCTWIVSLTIILKYLLNYGIKICQNVAYHLTIQKPYNVDRIMFGATSFANTIKPKSFDGSNFKFHNNQNKRKKPSQNPSKAKEANGPNKKKRNSGGACYTCGSPDHFAAKCPDRKDLKALKTTNMVVREGGGIVGYGNFLPTVLSVCSSPEWWIDTGANIHVCADISMFSSYQVRGTTSLLMENGAHARVWCWYGHSEVHFEEDHIIEECAACTYHQEESSQRVSTV
jgi:hypothetical protein